MTVLSSLDAAGRRRSPATLPGYHAGRPPRNKGMHYEEGGVAPLAGRIPTETDPRALLEIAVSITHNICKRCGDIIGAVYGAANVEPALPAVRDESRRRHREGIAWLTGRLADLGEVRHDLEHERAADMIAALTDPQVVRTFVTDYGWDWDDWHDWTVNALAQLVLPDVSPTGRR
jgi:hypothetical protein